MTTCAFCGSEKTPIYCFGDGQPICHECHTTLPNTIAACRHEIVKLREDAARLDLLDTNARFRVGWNVGRAPAGNLCVTSVGYAGATPNMASIRDAIDKVRIKK